VLIRKKEQTCNVLRPQCRLNCWALQNPRTVKEYENCKLALNTVQYIPLSHTARSVEDIFSFIISCFSLLFLLLCSHLSICVCLCPYTYLSFFPSFYTFAYYPLSFSFKSHINFSHWWKMVIRPILAKYRGGNSLVFLIAVSIILKLVKKSTVTTAWYELGCCKSAWQVLEFYMPAPT